MSLEMIPVYKVVIEYEDDIRDDYILTCDPSNVEGNYNMATEEGRKGFMNRIKLFCGRTVKSLNTEYFDLRPMPWRK